MTLIQMEQNQSHVLFIRSMTSLTIMLLKRMMMKKIRMNMEMKKIARITVDAAYNKLDPEGKSYGFELFGLDFIVDSSFKPWLIEINTNPCL